MENTGQRETKICSPAISAVRSFSRGNLQILGIFGAQNSRREICRRAKWRLKRDSNSQYDLSLEMTLVCKLTMPKTNTIEDFYSSTIHFIHWAQFPTANFQDLYPTWAEELKLNRGSEAIGPPAFRLGHSQGTGVIKMVWIIRCRHVSADRLRVWVSEGAVDAPLPLSGFQAPTLAPRNCLRSRK